MRRETIVIATTKSWNVALARALRARTPTRYRWVIITDPRKLSPVVLDRIRPRYIFFPHWSWIIPAHVHQQYECVVFHMTDLPYGRGGSPLQNLIERKRYRTKLSALRAGEGLDTGPIYMQVPFSVASGSAGDLLRSASTIIFRRMIPRILRERMTPTPQRGRATRFKRRTPAQSDMSSRRFTTLRDVNDFVRMLDGEGYPRAFVRIGPRLVMRLYGIRRTRQTLRGSFEVSYED